VQIRALLGKCVTCVTRVTPLPQARKRAPFQQRSLSLAENFERPQKIIVDSGLTSALVEPAADLNDVAVNLDDRFPGCGWNQRSHGLG